jgi:hypothetical protein
VHGSSNRSRRNRRRSRILNSPHRPIAIQDLSDDEAEYFSFSNSSSAPEGSDDYTHIRLAIATTRNRSNSRIHIDTISTFRVVALLGWGDHAHTYVTPCCISYSFPRFDNWPQYMHTVMLRGHSKCECEFVHVRIGLGDYTGLRASKAQWRA